MLLGRFAEQGTGKLKATRVPSSEVYLRSRLSEVAYFSINLGESRFFLLILFAISCVRIYHPEIFNGSLDVNDRCLAASEMEAPQHLIICT